MTNYFVYCRKSSEAEDRQVLSNDSQKRELLDLFQEKQNLKIIRVFEEAQSAKIPGRPIFNEMLKRLERGEAQGIIAWHPDRLARNSIDGGRIIYLIDQSKIQDLKFHSYAFDNSPEGVMMLGILFAQSKHFSDKLSKDVKRGNRTKLSHGWLPGTAPLGYLNTTIDNINVIVADPDRFTLVQKMWHLVASGTSVKQVLQTANSQWGLRTVKRRKVGGKPVSVSGIYRVLSDPFYYGWIRRSGDLHKGQHEPMITADVFERVQELLGRKLKPKPHRREFPFTGMMRCGECGAAITAEEKVNRFGSHYVYYRCTKRKKTPCSQRCIRAEKLEEQILSVIRSFAISEAFCRWGIRYLKRKQEEEDAVGAAIRETLMQTLADYERQMQNLLDLRLRGMITDEEYAGQKARLTSGMESIKGKLENFSVETGKRLELLETTFFFATRAEKLFRDAESHQKRLIVEIIGSNPTLRDRKLHIEAKKPFCILQGYGQGLSWQAIVEGFRTFCQNQQNIDEVRAVFDRFKAWGLQDNLKCDRGFQCGRKS